MAKMNLLPVKETFSKKCGIIQTHNDNEYLVEILLNDTFPLSIGTLSEEYINCGAFSFLTKYGKIKQGSMYYAQV